MEECLFCVCVLVCCFLFDFVRFFFFFLCVFL